MKKWTTATLLTCLLGYLAAAHYSGGAFPTLGLPIGGERALLRNVAMRFIEDIQFKDFDNASSYHAPDRQESVDIPYLIERLFAVKPEALDIMDYEIVFAKVDSTQLRARVKTRIKVKELVRDRIREQELILYFYRDSLDAPWYMKLESSLRSLEGDKKKKH
jgi:hypothetical protein